MRSLVLAGAFIFVQFGTVSATELKLVTQSYPPYSFLGADGTPIGASVEEMQSILVGTDIAYTMEIVPSARALALAETLDQFCFFGAGRLAERETRFKWVSPLFADATLLVANSHTSVHPATLADAKSMTIGTQRDTAIATILQNSGFRRLDLSSSFELTLAKLMERRIDLMTIRAATYRKLKREFQPLRAVLTLTDQEFGIACNKNIPDKVIAKLRAGLDRIRADGTMRSIFTKYGIEPD
ncbi:substrate-binding periplasmic protein [Rhizobium oryzicola]|uniref:Transporter substrate-binding domain-containing protein n=1 Tax=Rhizobium oryzicola TaxID=1232668 RepID=A0ABT8SVI9_9HYPH|nr:transporter substrate-binding domain-containing protein [Rhizobium oryzicola]MDO1582331.1 transporter substrate-binding domain-containing protein [Rhizobium oryzicola]